MHKYFDKGRGWLRGYDICLINQAKEKGDIKR